MAEPISIALVDSTGDLDDCFAAFRALRPHLVIEQFVEQVQRQFSQGYRILALRTAGQVQSVAGFRIAEYLAWGRVLYIDDLSTLPEARGQGYARSLLEWLIAEAKREGCDAVHLDSGHQRHAAHRLYLNAGFSISSHHFSLLLESD